MDSFKICNDGNNILLKPLRSKVVSGIASITLLIFSAITQAQSFNHLKDGLQSAEEGVIKVALLEPYFQMEKILAGGSQELRADWTQSASENFKAALFSVAEGQNIRFVEANISSDLANGRAKQVEKLNQVVGLSIIGNTTLKLPSKGDGTDWTIGEGAKLIAEHTQADYALYVYKQRGFTTGGAIAVSVLTTALFGVVTPTHYQFGFASLVDLRTGKVVYFNRISGSPGDLRTFDKSVPAVKTLLSGFPGLGFPEDPEPQCRSGGSSEVC